MWKARMCLAESGRKEAQYRKPCWVAECLQKANVRKRVFDESTSFRKAGVAPDRLISNLPRGLRYGCAKLAAKPDSGDLKSSARAASRTEGDKEWLAKTSALYYSSAKAGLTGFDCADSP